MQSACMLLHHRCLLSNLTNTGPISDVDTNKGQWPNIVLLHTLSIYILFLYAVHYYFYCQLTICTLYIYI